MHFSHSLHYPTSHTESLQVNLSEDWSLSASSESFRLQKVSNPKIFIKNTTVTTLVLARVTAADSEHLHHRQQLQLHFH